MVSAKRKPGAYYINFLKVLSNNSWFRRWKGRPFATYVARAGDYGTGEMRSTCGKGTHYVETSVY